MHLAFMLQITVRTVQDFGALARQTYVLGAILGLAFLLIAVIIASSIKFEGGSAPRDPGRRRLWFWLLFVLCFAACFLYIMFGVAPHVAANLQSRVMTMNVIGSCIAAALYLVVGFVLSKMFSTGKLGNWFR
jgi:uncharacterized membrane protein (DUF485 family)